jgi:hypothetical protein
MRRAYLLAAFVLMAPAALALSAGDYNSCIKLAKSDPAKGLAKATEWRDEGGAAAEHCAALALTGLKRYAEAAVKLEVLAKNKTIGEARNRAALLDQAGNAWLLARQGGKAAADFTLALGLTPKDVDMHADRARARALLKDWVGAEADISAAIQLDGTRADLFTLRASARRALGRKAAAAADITHALSLFPDYPAALVERGGMRYEAGDAAGARADWQAAAMGGGEAAAAAKRYLAQMGPEQKAKPAISK